MGCRNVSSSQSFSTMLLKSFTLITLFGLQETFSFVPTSFPYNSIQSNLLSTFTLSNEFGKTRNNHPVLFSNPNENDIILSTSKKLEGCVCIVTGASRGIGKGIALELGKEGATVYITGTSTSSSSSSSSTTTTSRYLTNEEVGGVGTIEETAELITSLGGKGIPVLCDHSDDEQVKQLFEQVEQEQGRLDMLINNAFRVPKGEKLVEGSFWDQGADVWDAMHTIGLRSHYVASCFAIPLMKKNPKTLNGGKGMDRPFIGMISSFGGLTYTFNVAYGVGKAGLDRLAKDMATELKKEDICVYSLWPGMVMTERMKKLVDNGEWDRTVGIPIDNAETPAYTGRAIVALATDGEHNMEKSGTIQVVAELAREYDFTDINGKQPPSIRSLKFLIPGYALDEETRKKVPEWMIPDWKLPFWVMAGGQPETD